MRLNKRDLRSLSEALRSQVRLLANSNNFDTIPYSVNSLVYTEMGFWTQNRVWNQLRSPILVRLVSPL
jgi:hypothetical protein